MTQIKAAAVAAARRGWAVFPCRPGDKRPAVPDWERRACPDPERVARYWPSRANVGIACGPSGLVVIDLDTADTAGHAETAPYGAARLAELCRQAGQQWPETLTVTTPRGGWHLYFRADPGQRIRNSASKIAAKIDVRAAGGYVVGPGSIVSGRPYQVRDDKPVACLPEWLARLARGPRPAPATPPRDPGYRGPAPGRLRGALAVVRAAPVGERNTCLHWASCRAAEMVTAGEVDEATAVTALTQAGEQAGLGSGEVRATIGSAFRRVMAA